MCELVMGDIDCQAAVFVYKNDCTARKAWSDVNAINSAHGGIRGEWHTCKSHFLAALKEWNESVDPSNAFLCVYSHMGEPGLNCVGHDTPSVITWEELADALPLGVEYLWLVGCTSQECMKAWSPLGSPVRHRLLATKESIYWGPLLKVFAAEISTKRITHDDQMAGRITEVEPELAKHTQYFGWHNGAWQED